MLTNDFSPADVKTGQHNYLNTFEKSGHYFLYLFIIVASSCLSYWMAVRTSIVNPDAICYLLSAETIARDGIQKAMHLCSQASWPFYPFIIHLITQFTHLSFELSAYIIDALFSIVSALFFISIIRILGGNKQILWIAAIVFLSSHTLNSTREYIIRDHGYWAFYLASIYFFIRFTQSQQLKYALAWNSSIIIASLFRIEGIFFLAGMPFIVLFYPSTTLKVRTKLLLGLHTVSISAALIALIWYFFHATEMQHQWGRLTEIPTQIQHGLSLIINRFQITKAMLAKYVLTEFSKSDAALVLSLLMVIWYVIANVANISLVYAALVLYAWLKKIAPFEYRLNLILYAYLFINLVVTFVFFAEALFLSKRYLIGMTLVLMLWVPFALNDILNRKNERLFQSIIAIITILMSTAVLSTLIEFGHSKKYIRVAGEWIQNNIPQKSALYSNDIQLSYYSKHYGIDIFKHMTDFRAIKSIAGLNWKQYNFIALKLDRYDDARTLFDQTPIKTFANRQGDRVEIYQLSG